jgi:hypothetical protein
VQLLEGRRYGKLPGYLGPHKCQRKWKQGVRAQRLSTERAAEDEVFCIAEEYQHAPLAKQSREILLKPRVQCERDSVRVYKVDGGLCVVYVERKMR